MKSFDRGEVLASIHERAASDPNFRALLLSDPSAAVSEVLGMPVPAAVRFTVHEESPTDIHLVIPAAVDLADADLELVSGGEWAYVSCASGCE
jgi:hypothetical protein